MPVRFFPPLREQINIGLFYLLAYDREVIMYRTDLRFVKHHQGKINFLKEKRNELLEIVNAGPYSSDQDYIYEAIWHLSEEIVRLENEKHI